MICLLKHFSRVNLLHGTVGSSWLFEVSKHPHIKGGMRSKCSLKIKDRFHQRLDGS